MPLQHITTLINKQLIFQIKTIYTSLKHFHIVRNLTSHILIMLQLICNCFCENNVRLETNVVDLISSNIFLNSTTYLII